MKLCHRTCSLLSKGFRSHVRRQHFYAVFNEPLLAVPADQYHVGSEPCNMVEEDQAGITCYANSARGFRGILKHRYSDFIVNEVDCEGNVVHLTCLTAGKELSEADNEELQEDEEINPLNLEKKLEAFNSITGDGDVELLRGLLTNYTEGKREDCAPIVLTPDTNKAHRTEVHNFFKNRFSFLVTDTVDGPDSKSKCVRVRILTGKRGREKDNMKRGKGSHNQDKSKRQKHDRDNQGFDSRGAGDNWPSQQGKYLQFHLYKENKDTHDALTVLGKMIGVQSKSFGIAGTKDKRAVTTQRVTVFKQRASKLAALNRKLYGIKVGDFSYVDDALVLGQLSGNQFTVTLRGVAAEHDEIFKEAAVSLQKSGFINYFGLQRFGTGSVSTFTVGAALLRGEWQAAVDLILQPRDDERQNISEARKYFQRTRDADGTLLRLPRHFVTERAVLTGLRKSAGNYLQAINGIPRTMRMMFIHSYQSYLWNHAASKRITLYGVDKVVEGDLVLCKDSAGMATASKGEITQEEEICSETVGEEFDDIFEATSDERFDFVRHATAEDVACQKFGILDVVLPLPGCRTMLPANDVASVYEELARRDSLDLKQSSHNVKDFSFLHLPGSYRRLIQEPKDFDWKILKYDDHTRALAETDWDIINKNTPKEKKKEQVTKGAVPVSPIETKEDGKEAPIEQTAFQLKFTLPSSCYATMALRELMKISSSVGYHKDLTEQSS